MQRSQWFLTTITALMVILSYTTFVQAASPAKSSSISDADADTAMQAYIAAFYDPKAKQFYYDTTRTKYNDFWKEAISWDIVMDAYQRNPANATYRQMITDVYDGFMADKNSFDQGMSTACNTSGAFTIADPYNDDVGWWANASIRAFTLTHEKRYLNCAKRLFDLIYQSWNTSTYGGGILWLRTSSNTITLGKNTVTQNKNIVTNAPAAITAAQLAMALPDPTYLTKAEMIYNWVKSKLTNGSGVVYDSVIGKAQIAKNYGVFIGAADALYQATKNRVYLTDANNAAQQSLTRVAINGILKAEGMGDIGASKGVYAYYLAGLATTYGQSQYLGSLRTNAMTAWNNRRTSDNLVGNNWTIPTPTGTIETHTDGSVVAILQVIPVQTASPTPQVAPVQTASPTPQVTPVQTASPAESSSISGADADTAMQAYIAAFYDPKAKQFYYDTTRTTYNDYSKEAISWDIVMDAYQRNPANATYRQMITDVYDGFMAYNQDISTACNTSGAFTIADPDNGNVGWWANVSIRAFTLTHESRYLNCAKRLFDLIYQSWNTSSDGGGIWWTRSNPVQKNVVTNAPAAITAVGLSAALSDRSYLTKAEMIYDWVKSKLTNGSGTIYDNYDSGTLHTQQLAKNYGVFIGAADALYQATKNRVYLTDANNAAQQSLTHVTTNGILKAEGTGDIGASKGVYAYYLAGLATTYGQSQYLDFLRTNAMTAWNNRRTSDNLVGNDWTIPTPTGTIETHTAGSAVAILQVTPSSTPNRS